MNTILPIDVESSTIAKLRAIYGKSANIQQGYIRLEKVLSQSSTSETFTLGEGRSNGTKRPLENFLSQSDNFVPVYFRCGIQKQWVSTGEVAPDVKLGNNGNQPVYTYPDLSVFNRLSANPNALIGCNVVIIPTCETIFVSINSTKFLRFIALLI
jgi:hypothetical protein